MVSPYSYSAQFATCGLNPESSNQGNLLREQWLPSPEFTGHICHCDH